MSIYRVNCVRIDSKDKFYFLLDTDATDAGVIESQAKSDALKQQAKVESISEEQPSMNFAKTLEYLGGEIWNSKYPERPPLEWESEYLVKEVLSWLSEEDQFKILVKETDLIEEYALPEEWNDELKPMIEFLKESLTGLGTYFEDS